MAQKVKKTTTKVKVRSWSRRTRRRVAS